MRPNPPSVYQISSGPSWAKLVSLFLMIVLIIEILLFIPNVTVAISVVVISELVAVEGTARLFDATDASGFSRMVGDARAVLAWTSAFGGPNLAGVTA